MNFFWWLDQRTRSLGNPVMGAVWDAIMDAAWTVILKIGFTRSCSEYSIEQNGNWPALWSKDQCIQNCSHKVQGNFPIFSALPETALLTDK